MLRSCLLKYTATVSKSSVTKQQSAFSASTDLHSDRPKGIAVSAVFYSVPLQRGSTIAYHHPSLIKKMLKNIDPLNSTFIFSLLLLTALVGCGPQAETVDPNGDTADKTAGQTAQPNGSTSDGEKRTEGDDSSSNSKAPENQSGSTPKPIFPALAAGEYCYAAKTETETIQARVAIDALDIVTGNVQGSVHNEASSYYTAYSQSVNGVIDGSNLNLDVTTWIEYDKQNTQETWKVSDSALTIEGQTLDTESCNTVSKAFQNEDGLEAKDLTSGANGVFTQQVFFDPGSTSTVVSSAVVRGDRDVYTITAQGGQQMTLSISSTEDNAVFDVVSPSSLILGTELTQDNILLPHTGDYEIIVGGTRGNATYDLSIEIK